MVIEKNMSCFSNVVNPHTHRTKALVFSLMISFETIAIEL